MVAKYDVDGQRYDWYGNFEAAITMAHHVFRSWSSNDFAESAKITVNQIFKGSDRIPADQSSTLTFSGTSPQVELERGGHGAFALPSKGDPKNGDPYHYDNADFYGGDGIVYFPGTVAEIPSGGDDRHVYYRLLPINDLWDRRHDYDETFSDYSVFKSDKGGCGLACTTDGARAPWGMYHKLTDDKFKGWWFELPAELFEHAVSGQIVDSTYGYRSVGKSWESYHDYEPNLNHQIGWANPGASSISISLERVILGSGDRLEFSDSTRTIGVLGNSPYGIFSGGVVVMSSDRVSIKFVSDSAGEAEGFYITIS